MKRGQAAASDRRNRQRRIEILTCGLHLRSCRKSTHSANAHAIMPQLSKPRRLIWLLFVVASTGWYLDTAILDALSYIGPGLSDFRIYHDASRALLQGKSPFSIAGYIYPPVLSFLLLPTALLDYEAARLLWFWINQACLLTSGVLIWKAAGGDRTATLVTVSVWAFGGAALNNLALGQVNPVLLLLLSTAWYFTSRRSRVGATALGLAAAIKLWPGAMLLYYSPSRDWKGMGVGLLTFFTFAALPWMGLRYFVPPPHAPAMSNAWMGTPALFNFSLPAVALRMLDPPTVGQRLPFNWEFGLALQEMDLPPAHAAASVGLGCLIYIAGVILLFWSSRGRKDRRMQPLWLAALTSLALVCAPVAWSHYQLLQYPGAAYLLASFLRQGRSDAALFVAAAFLGVNQIPSLGLEIYLGFYGWTMGNPAALWLFSSMASFCGLLFIGVCLRECRRVSGHSDTEH